MIRTAISRPSSSLPEALDLFERAAEYGFSGVQAKPQQYGPVEGDPARFRSIFGGLSSLVKAGFVVYPGGDPLTWEEKLVPLLSFSGDLGAEELCVCASVDKSDESESRFALVAKILNSIGERGKKHKVRVSLHNHAGCLFETADDLERIAARLDPALCGLTFDTAHAAKGGMCDLAAPIKRLSKYITNVHLKDLDHSGNFCMLGKGTLALKDALRALLDIGYDKWLVVDEETKGVDNKEACAVSAGFLRENKIM